MYVVRCWNFHLNLYLIDQFVSLMSCKDIRSHLDLKVVLISRGWSLSLLQSPEGGRSGPQIHEADNETVLFSTLAKGIYPR